MISSASSVANTTWQSSLALEQIANNLTHEHHNEYVEGVIMIFYWKDIHRMPWGLSWKPKSQHFVLGEV